MARVSSPKLFEARGRVRNRSQPEWCEPLLLFSSGKKGSASAFLCILIRPFCVFPSEQCLSIEPQTYHLSNPRA